MQLRRVGQAVLKQRGGSSSGQRPTDLFCESLQSFKICFHSNATWKLSFSEILRKKNEVQMLVVQTRISFALTRVSISKSSLVKLLCGNRCEICKLFFFFFFFIEKNILVKIINIQPASSKEKHGMSLAICICSVGSKMWIWGWRVSIWHYFFFVYVHIRLIKSDFDFKTALCLLGGNLICFIWFVFCPKSTFFYSFQTVYLCHHTMYKPVFV